MVQSTALTKEQYQEAFAYAQKVADDLNEAVTEFHAVQTFKDKLVAEGFTQLKEIDAWHLEAGKSYFFTRNHSTFVAFRVGKQCGPEHGVSLFKMLGCHTDSPCFKIAPVSKLEGRSGFTQLTVQTYGGGLWYTWFDRDLILAGKVIVRSEGKLQSRLWRSKHAIARIANLCIHLRTERGTFNPNNENETKPIIATSIVDALFGSGNAKKKDEETFELEGRHSLPFLSMIAEDLGVQIEDLMDFQLNFVDQQAAQFIGLHKEFLVGGRLDNLVSSLPAVDSIAAMTNLENAEVTLLMNFDHEEIGSLSAQGADSNLAAEVTERIYSLLKPAYTREDYWRAIHRSLLLSCDVAHALHPNYASHHQPSHAPLMQKGIVFKTRAN